MNDIAYHGNPNLKPIGLSLQYTQEQILELIKCQQDAHYFIENYCYIVTLDEGLKLFKLYECQKKKIDVILNNRKVVLMEGRQQGKTITAAACILWYTLFQESKTVAILANKGSSAREVLSRYQTMYENLPVWLQQGVRTWNKGDVELENGSRIFTSATTTSGIRGKSVNWLYIDEAAIIPNNVAEEFFASVYPTISAGVTTKILLTSTPLGYNHFWKFWNEAEQEKNGFVPFFVPYWEIPGRDEKWADEQLRTLGEVKYNQEVLCQFLGSSNTLISGRALSVMSSIEPIFKNMNFDIYENPQPNHQYIIVVDVSRGIGGDYSAFTVVDVTESPYKLVAKYRDNKIAPMLLISPGFSKSTTKGIRTNKSVKRIGCFGLKSLIEEQKLLIFDADTISELSTFVEKNGSFSADVGYSDDLVMTLVLFGWLTTNQYFKELTNIDIRAKMYEQQMQQIADEMTPFGFIDDGVDNEEKFIDNNVLWSTDTELPWKNIIS